MNYLCHYLYSTLFDFGPFGFEMPLRHANIDILLSVEQAIPM